MALYHVRSPFNSTAYLGTRDSGTNPCSTGSTKYWHLSGTVATRGFDMEPCKQVVEVVSRSSPAW